VRRQLDLTTAPIAEAALVAQRRMSAGAGAVLTFVGVVRGEEAGQAIRGLDYEAYARMAEHQFELIFQEIERRWPIESVRVVHRVGLVQVNEPSLWVEVVAPHRGEAFAAGQFLIEQMKQRVPIWKRPVA
jgi:molybdopterin synthase catalytic subunit